MGSTSIADFVYFKLVYDYLEKQIDTFGMTLMANLMAWASGVAVAMVTLWVMIQGYRIVTGQAREPAMAMVTHSIRVVVVVFAATTMGIFGSSLHQLFTTDLSTGINQLFTGGTDTAAQAIDKNLAWTQLALAAIDVVQVAPGDTQNIEAKSHTALIAGLGTASPPMAAGAMLLLYQFTIAIFIGLGPLFILCLIFDQTRDLFRKWLMYGIGTLFSMAMLAAVTSICLQLSLRVAAALWTSSQINSMTGLGAEGLSNQALQQGGIGLLLTVLIISVPPMTAMFFQGTVGNFMPYSQFGGSGNRLGPQGQTPGTYATGAHAASTRYTQGPPQGAQMDNVHPVADRLGGLRGTVIASAAQTDIIRTRPSERT